MTKILVAPDKFKGSLSAGQVAQATKKGLLKQNPNLEVTDIGLADGGEGSVSAALAAGFTALPITVTGPTGESLSTSLAMKNRTILIETASICGLGVLPGGCFAPLRASSFGVGEAINEALAHKPETIVLALGGVATTDGGAGMLQALGAELSTATGKPIRPGASGLLDLEFANPGNARKRLDGVDILIATDVVNPLLGPQGAAAVYAPQKGASKVDVQRLEFALNSLVSALERSGLSEARQTAVVPGSGAAGGLGFAGLLLHGRIRSGAEYFLSLLEIDDALGHYDLVVTGEGSLDKQSLSGKLPVVLAKHANALGIPVHAVVGKCALSPGESQQYFNSVLTLTELTNQDSAHDSELSLRLVEKCGYRIAEELSLERHSKVVSE